MGKYAILVVSALIFSMITYSHALRNALFISNARTVESYSQNQAHNIAQSAAMVVINNLRNDSDSSFKPGVGNVYSFPSPDGFEPWPEMDGEYHIGVTNQADTMLVLSSTGRFEDTIYSVTLGLELGESLWNPEFNQALHAENLIDLEGTVDIECEHDDLPCQVTTNSIKEASVKVSGSSKIDGDLFVGPNGDLNKVVTGQENISGELGVMSQKLNYPMPNFPDFNELNFLNTGESISDGRTLNPQDYDKKHIDSINLSGRPSTLTINTGDEDRELKVGFLELGGQNKIEVIGEGKLSIYVDYKFEMKGGSEIITEDGNVKQIMVYYKGNQDVEISEYDETLQWAGNTLLNGSLFADKANIKFTGTAGVKGNVITGGDVELYGTPTAISRLIYTPNGRVEMRGTSVIRGAVVADSFFGKGTPHIIFDQDFEAELPDLFVDGGGFDIVYWN